MDFLVSKFMNIKNNLYYFLNFQIVQPKSEYINGRVVGGVQTQPYSYPFICSLQRVVSATSQWHTCGSSIISPNWLLSAAHCVTLGPDAYEVWCGRWNFALNETNREQVRQIDIIRYHESFSFETLNHWDVAVVSAFTYMITNIFIVFSL